MRTRLLVLVTAVVSCASLALPASAAQGGPTFDSSYGLPGTFVLKQANQPPIADEGAMVCSPSRAVGVGGGCVSFGLAPDASSVEVLDAVQAHNVAFQVCIDNNGDGRCVSPDKGECPDQIFFSHDDEGRFFNPLGGLPTHHLPGCPGGVWDGYVVFLCTGVHNAGTAHSHQVTAGTISTRNFPGTGFGNFCGGTPQDPTNKAYVVVN